MDYTFNDFFKFSAAVISSKMEARLRYQPQYYVPNYNTDNNGNYWNYSYAAQPGPSSNFTSPPIPSYISNQCSYQPPPTNYAVNSYNLPPIVNSRSIVPGIEVVSSYRHGSTVIMMDKKRQTGWRKHKALLGVLVGIAIMASVLWAGNCINGDGQCMNTLSAKLEPYQFSPLDTLKRWTSLAHGMISSPSPIKPARTLANDGMDARTDNNSGAALPERSNAIPKKTRVVWSFDEDNDDEVLIEDIFTHTLV